MKANKRGRSRGGPPFIQLHHWIMDSAAWLSLPPGPRSVYLALRRRYNGTNNGTIALGCRDAARLAGISKNTAPKCFAELIAKGFVECTTPGGFNQNSRKASEWRLTSERCDKTGALPSKAFMKWKPAEGKPSSQSRDRQVPNEGHPAATRPETVPGLGPKPVNRAA